MNYEMLLSDVKEVTKDQLKEILFEVDQRNIDKIKAMDLDEETMKKLIVVAKDYGWFAMLLINALKEE